jgi:hypothetical protein
MLFNDNATIALSMYVAIPNAKNYSWASGVAPATSSRGAMWSYNASPGAAQAVSAVNLSDQSKDVFWLFTAGAFLGVAGGAAIGLFQELFKPGRA